MRRRPAWFIFLSLAYLGIALALPAQIMVLYGHGFEEWSAVLAKLTLLNWMVIGGALISAVLVWQASAFLRYSVPAMIAIITVNNLVVGFYATDYSMLATIGGTIAFVLLNFPLLHPKIQWLLIHPDKRWWMRAERKRLTIPITIEGTRLLAMQSETFDVSESGAFITSDKEFAIGDWLTVRMKFGMFRKIRCQARVVRRAKPAGIYPSGVGVQFVNMSWRDRRELKRCLEISH